MEYKEANLFEILSWCLTPFGDKQEVECTEEAKLKEDGKLKNGTIKKEQNHGI